MIADPRYYLAVIALFGAVFFLQPTSTASAVGLAYRINASAFRRSFRLFARERIWFAGIGLSVSLALPSVFGVHLIGPLFLASSCFLICVLDYRSLSRLAAKATELSENERS